MNIFGMGPLEILLIVVLALIVFGPAKLPEIMGQVGRAIADFRRATSELSDEFNRTIQAELAETRSVVDETKSAVTGVHSSINTAISGVTAPVLSTPAPAPTLTASPGNGVTTTTNGTAVATNEPPSPPMADTAQWSWETAAPAPATSAVETRVPEPVPATEAPNPVEPAVAEPAARPLGSRRTSGRNDLLPPY
jgi:TatA/E family protein of Tat protein translocase